MELGGGMGPEESRTIPQSQTAVKLAPPGSDREALRVSGVL
jgi:hypothetical protein